MRRARYPQDARSADPDCVLRDARSLKFWIDDRRKRCASFETARSAPPQDEEGERAGADEGAAFVAVYLKSPTSLMLRSSL